jgi:hypothetical protein
MGKTRDTSVMLCTVGRVLGVHHNSRKRMGGRLRVGSPRRGSGGGAKMSWWCSDEGMAGQRLQ